MASINEDRLSGYGMSNFWLQFLFRNDKFIMHTVAIKYFSFLDFTGIKRNLYNVLLFFFKSSDQLEANFGALLRFQTCLSLDQGLQIHQVAKRFIFLPARLFAILKLLSLGNFQRKP